MDKQELSPALPRIILWDLETLPNLPEVLKVFTRLGDYPGLTLKATHSSIICFGYKVLGEKVTKCICAWDFKSRWKKDINDDYELVKAASKILQTADVIVTHNGKSFDFKFLQTRLLYHGLPPLPKILHIDTKNESKKNLYAFNNSLNILAKAFTNTKKLDNGGWDLWVDVHAKKASAMKLMKEYCMQDVVTLEALFERLKPMITSLPNANMFYKENNRCPKCGSQAVQKRGRRLAGNNIKQSFACLHCGGWSLLTIKGLHING